MALLALLASCASEPTSSANVEALTGGTRDVDRSHDYVGTPHQPCTSCPAGDSPLNPDASDRCDCYDDEHCGPLTGGCNVGNGTLITPTIVVYARSKYPIALSGHELARESQHHRYYTTLPSPYYLPFTTAPSVLASDVGTQVSAEDVHSLAEVWERRGSRMGRWCQHPQRGVHEEGGRIVQDYAFPAEADWGRRIDELYPITNPLDERAVYPAWRWDRTYDIYRQRCADPLEPGDAPASDLLFFVLRERVTDVTPARPIFANPGVGAGADPMFWSGRNATVSDFGFDGAAGTNAGFRTTRDVTLTGVYPAFLEFSEGGSELRNIIGSDATGLDTGSSAAPFIVDVDGEPRVLQTANGLFLGDDVIASWLDPDGDGHLRGEIDAWDGIGTPDDPAHCLDGDGDCFGNNDNCDHVANPSQRDSDGDGLGDECDLCPMNWDPVVIPTDGRVSEPVLPLTRTTQRSYPAPTCIARHTAPADPFHPAVRIGDVIGAGCSDFGLPYAAVGGAAVTRVPTPIVATDDPMTPDVNEAATGIAQIWETSHADGVDVVFDDAMGTDATDFDGDGIPFLCDNCPDVPNPDQRACEGVFQPDPGRPGEMREIGFACARDNHDDADGDGIPNECDPCPNVPQSYNCNADAETARGLPALPDACDPTPCAAVSASVTAGIPIAATTSVVTTARLRGPALISTSTGIGRAETTGNVGFRFCRCGLATSDHEGSRQRCLQAGNGNCRLRALDAVGSEVDLFVGDDSGAWRTMRLTRPDGTAVTEVTTTFTSDAVTSRDVDMVWPFATDPAALPLLPAPSAPGTQGVIWTTVRASPGCTTADDPALCGLLASHYWSGLVVGGTVHGPNPSLVDGTAFVPWLADQRVCTYCAGSFPAEFLGTLCPTDAGCLPERWVLRSDRLEEPAAPQLSAALSKSFLDPLTVWTMPSEPRELLAEDSIRMVGRSFGQITARVTTVGTTFGLIEELGQSLPKPSNERLTAAAAAFATSSDPNPTGRGAVLMAREGQLLTFGGDMVERQELTYVDLVRGQSTPVHLTGDRPGYVLAATHRVVSPSVLVLDRVPPRRARRRFERYADDREQARLILIDMRTASARVVASFPWLRRFDRYALATMANGDSVLVASNSVSRRHQVLRFRVVEDRRGALRVEVVARAEGAGSLLAPPLVSREGISIAVQPRGRGWTSVGYELLPPRRREERGLDDCF